MLPFPVLHSRASLPVTSPPHNGTYVRIRIFWCVIVSRINNTHSPTATRTRLTC